MVIIMLLTKVIPHKRGREVELLKRSHAQHLHFLFGEETPVATTQVLLGESGKLNAVEFHDAIAQALKDTTDDAVLTRVDFNAHLRLVLLIGISNSVGMYFAIVEGDTFGYLLNVVSSNVFVQIYVVDLLLEELRVSELRGEVLQDRCARGMRP